MPLVWDPRELEKCGQMCLREKTHRCQQCPLTHLESNEGVEIPGNVIFVYVCPPNHGARNPPHHRQTGRTRCSPAASQLWPVAALTLWGKRRKKIIFIYTSWESEKVSPCKDLPPLEHWCQFLERISSSSARSVDRNKSIIRLRLRTVIVWHHCSEWAQLSSQTYPGETVSHITVWCENVL